MLTFADLCAGIGGFRVGLEDAGWKCCYSCEIDDLCEETYKANFSVPFDAKNIFDVNPAELLGVDAICSGFPCQPFSIAGKRRGFGDKRGSILHRLLEIVSVVMPPIVILENVANFASHNKGASFSFAVEALSRLGYDVQASILNSAHFKVPQSRPRIYIVAIRRSLNALFFSITKQRTKPEPFRPYIRTGDKSIPISDRWHQYIDLYSGKKPLSEFSFRVPKTRELLERVNKGADISDCILQMRSSGIRACNIDAPLPTFAVSVSGGGAMIPVYTRERRHLSLSEMTSLMGFPPNFSFPVARTHAIKQLANAVCPPVVSSLAQDIQMALPPMLRTSA
jgi:DNA (cytosine-5)-methyltransferase 1